MRTESSAATRLRDMVARARRWAGGSGRGARLSLLALGVAAVAAAVYLAVPADRDEVEWLYAGRRFSPDAADAIMKALAIEKIAWKTDAGRRVGVVPARWSDAMAALEKHGVEPESLERIGKDRPEPSLWEGPAERAERDRRTLERKLKATIEGYGEGIRSADVTILRATPRVGHRPASEPRGVVILDTDRTPPHRIIQSIRTLLPALVQDLKRDAVTVGDRAGNFYLNADDPTAASTTQSLARAQELRDALLQGLGPLIQGVDVVVRVEPPAPAEAPPSPTPATHPGPHAPPHRPSPDEVRSNAPIGLDPDPEPDPVAPPAPAPSPSHPAPGPGPGRANVWVKVPRSYYLRIFRENAPNRQPSADELAAYDQKTRALVENAVRMHVPAAERGQILVNTILDDLGAGGPLVVPAGSADAPRTSPAWLPPVALGAGVGLGVAMVLGTGFGMMAARRPTARPSRAGVRSGVVVDPPTGAVPGPSERVRDLVRRDPEAAAGVLRRWIGQSEGGPIG